LSKSNSLSNRRSAAQFKELQQEEQGNKKLVSIHVTDSGIEDPSAYLESTGIRVGESEFQLADNDASLMEGSVADTDYAERMCQRHSTKRPCSKEPDSLLEEDMTEKAAETVCKSDDYATEPRRFWPRIDPPPDFPKADAEVSDSDCESDSSTEPRKLCPRHVAFLTHHQLSNLARLKIPAWSVGQTFQRSQGS
jgi:hypothetical protein